MYSVERIEKDVWREKMSGNAHLSVFGEELDESLDRSDFTLLVVKDLSPVIYTTITELTSQKVSLEYGGSFPDFRSSIHAYPAFVAMLEKLRETYKAAYMRVRHDNFEMLKFALKAKFKTIGISLSERGGLLLEQELNF